MSRVSDAFPAWLPEIGKSQGPWANRLADAIADAVSSGKLAPGDLLPTQRALAQQLGVTTGTVNRGYAIAQRAGWVRTEVGRGTYVAGASDRNIRSTSLGVESRGAINLGLNYPAGVEAEQLLGKALAVLGRRKSCAGLLSVSPYEGQAGHRAAGARLLQHLGLSVNADQVVLSTSVQHGLTATLSALAAPGDTVLTEHLTSPGIKAVAAMRQLRLSGVAGDSKGILPEALLETCRASNARILYTMPALHTPTALTMPDDRRQALADVIRKQQLTAIEDDAWGFLAKGSVTALRMFAPDHVVYLTSTSKSLAPGLRVGYVVAPSSLQQRLISCIGNTTWTAPLMAALVSLWIEDGTAASIMEQRTQSARRRQALAEKLLGRSVVHSRIPTFHLWLPLPEPWRVDEFVNHAARHGVALASTDIFVPGRDATPHAIRLCTGTEPDIARVESAIRIIAGMLQSGPAGHSLVNA